MDWKLIVSLISGSSQSMIAQSAAYLTIVDESAILSVKNDNLYRIEK